MRRSVTTAIRAGKGRDCPCGRKGEVWRIAAEITLHQTALRRFGQWWRETVRVAG